MQLYVCIYNTTRNLMQVFPVTKHKKRMLKIILAFMGKLLQNLSKIDGLDD